MESKRILAATRGELVYFTGKPCRYGHLSERGTVDGACRECRAVALKRDKDKIKELLAAAQSAQKD